MGGEDLEIRIDRLALEVGDSAGAPAPRRALVEEALLRLAERLAGSPLRARPLRTIALDRLSVSALSESELSGPRGAERLADELYAELVRRLP